MSHPSGKRTVYTILLSVCLFLGVVCACLLVALVLIGRNIAHSSLQCNSNFTHNNINNNSDVEYVSDEGAKLDEISVKLRDVNLKVVPGNQDWRSGWRLPRDVEPLSYDLTFKPNLLEGGFQGTTNITITTKEARDHFVLHGHNLNITKVEMFSVNEQVEVVNFHNDSAHQLWVVDVENTLPPGVYYLKFEYNGVMKGKRVGLYQSTYLNANETRRNIATSKLEPTYARQAFPCFDEPNFKAKYTVHLQIPAHKEGEQKYIALSNMDQNGEPEAIPGDENHMMVHFNESVPMSTYVSCFIVCDFEYESDTINSTSGKKIPLRVYATPAQTNKTLYALSVAKAVTEYYEQYFDISYPLPKLDMIAIPDFVSGAMEHWGLVTYRETALLYSNETGNAANKQRVATVVAHELAHMWFGNLVTLDWWNDLWLNEGFATYMQFKAINKLNQQWGMADQFLIDELHPVLDFDSTLATHPIVVSVTTPDQITEIFDSISYNKGASVLRMLENAIGEENFQKGIQNYLRKHSYKNAVTQDLWDELQATEPEFNVKDVMATWTEQEGYPILKVTIEEGPNPEGMGKIPVAYKLTQRRFLQNTNFTTTTSYKWTIPITYTTDLEQNFTTEWFNATDNSLSIKYVTDAKWIKFNIGQVGYYRVMYTLEQWISLIKYFDELSPADQTNLLEDSFSIAKSGQLNYSYALDFSEKMKSQGNFYVPWTVTLSKFGALKTLLKNNLTIYDKYKKHVQNVITPIYKNLSWSQGRSTTDDENDDDKHQSRLLRAKVLNAACSYEIEGARDEARKRFTNWLNNASIQLDLSEKGIIYKYGMEQATKEEWGKMSDKYVNEIDAAEKLKLLHGLAAVNNIDLLRLLIDRAEKEEFVRKQDYFTCLQYISSNDIGTGLVWDYVRENWEKLVDRFGLNDRYLGRLIPTITSSFVTTTRLDEMKAFFEKHPEVGAGEISRKQALETVQNNINWVQNYQDDVKKWLDHRY